MANSYKEDADKKVIMKGGTSGCADDYLPPEVAQTPQPMLDTSRSGAYQSDVLFTSEESKSTHKPWNTATGDVPAGAKPRTKDLDQSTTDDVQQQDVSGRTFGVIKPALEIRRQLGER